MIALRRIGIAAHSSVLARVSLPVWPRVTRLSSLLALSLAAALLLAACGDRSSSGVGTGTGGITVDVIWRTKASAKKIKFPQYQTTLVEGVETVRATVSGSGFDPMTKDTPFEAGGDEISGVPVGVNRTLTLQGLDADGSILYEGVVTGIVVKAGESSEAGTVVMEPTFAGFSIVKPSNLTLQEDGSPKTLRIRPHIAPAEGMTIVLNVTIADSTEATVDTAMPLTWDDTNFNAVRTVQISPVDDDEADGNQDIEVELDSSASTDLEYKVLAIASIELTVSDTTHALTITPSSLSTAEGGTPQGFTIRPNTNPGNQTITVEITSTDETEATVSPASLEWDSEDWETEKSVVVTPVNDDVADGNQTFNISVDPSESGDTDYAALGILTVEVTNSDNDTAGVTVTESGGTSATTEAGGTDTFTVVLNTKPTGDVVILLESQDTGEVRVSAGGAPAASIELLFDEDNWATPQTVTLTGQNDDEDDGNQTVTIALTMDTDDTEDTLYDAENPADVSVTNSDNDTAGITVNPTSGHTVTEAGTTSTFTVVLNTLPTGNVVVEVESQDSTEIYVNGPSGTPAASATLTFTTSDWSTAQTVTITGRNDNLGDGNQNVTITLVTTDATTADVNYDAVDPADVAVTNSDNDTVGVTVNPTSGLTTTEAGGTATFTVVLTTEPTANVVIDVASGNSDEVYVNGPAGTPAASATLTFTTSDWSTAQTVTLTGRNDDFDDGNQGVTIALSTNDTTTLDNSYDAVDPADVSVTNSDDDTAGFTITPTSLSITEGGAAKTFTIRPNTNPDEDTVTVDIGSTDTTEGTVSPSSLSWDDTDWQTAKTVTVTPFNDVFVDGTQNFDIELDPGDSTEANYAALSIQHVDIATADNDVAGVTVTPTSGLSVTEDETTATFTVVLNTQPSDDVVIDVDSLDTTEVYVHGPSGTPDVSATLTFTSGDWNTPQTVTITGQDDMAADGNQTVTVRLAMNTGSTDDPDYDPVNPADVSVTNLDNESPGVTVSPTSGLSISEYLVSDTFSVVLNTLPTDDVVINVTSLDTTEATVDKSTLTFTTANWSSPQVVTVTGVNDVVIDGNILVTIQLTMDTDDPEYDAIEPDDVTATNADNDAAGVTVTPTSGLITSEDGLFSTFTVALNTAPDGDVVIDLVESDLSEISLDTYELTFTASDWSTPQTVTVYGEDDLLEDGSQNVTVQLTINGAGTEDTTGYAALNPPDVSVVNIDDDAVGITVTPSSTLLTTEGGGSATFTVLLNTEPDGDVVIDVTPADGTEIDVNKATLTFTTADWATPQTVTVTGLDDGLTDGNQATTVDLDVNVDDTDDTTGYEDLTRVSVNVVNSDNDVPGVTVLPTSGLVTTEGGATATFSVVLNKAPNGNVVILLFNETDEEITIDKASLTFTTSDWQTPQIVTLTGESDGLADGTQPTAVTLTTDTLLTTDTTGYDSVNPADVSGINLDNNAGVTVNPTSGLVTTEAGAVTTFTVQLNTQPTGDVVINVSSGDPLEVAVDKAVLTFTTDDWATPQVVTLTGVDDGDADGSPVITISLSMNGGLTEDGVYALLNPSDVTVTNVDDDSGGFTVTPTSGLITTESGASDTFTVRLNLPPDGDVVIDVASSNTSEASVNVSTLTFTTSDWSTPQTVTVTGVNDSTADGDVALTIQLTINGGLTTDTTGYAGLNPDDVGVTNEDNESVGQGTSGSPLNLNGTLPYSGSVGGQYSYYAVSGLASGTYLVSTSSVSANLALAVYEDTTYSPELCSANANANALPEACQAVVDASGTLVIRVEIIGSTAGATFVVDVVPLPSSEGASGSPLNITSEIDVANGVGYQGGVNAACGAGFSYYLVTGLTPSANYRVELKNLTANVNLRVDDDANFNDPSVCTASNSNIAEACQGAANGSGNLYIRVANGPCGGTGANLASTVASYLIRVLNPLTNEGTSGAPIELGSGNLPYDGMVLSGNSSYYRISGLRPGVTYSVEMINMAGQGELRTYSDAFTTETCNSDAGGNLPEFCSVAANGSGVIYLRGGNNASLGSGGATYTIQVK